LVVADGAWSQGKLKVPRLSRKFPQLCTQVGRVLLSGSDDNAVKLWDTLTGALIHSDAVLSVASSSDGGPRVLSGSYDGISMLWNAATGELIHTFEGHSDPVRSVTFSPYGARVLSGNTDGTLKL